MVFLIVLLIEFISLSECGHTFCYACLKNQFKKQWDGRRTYDPSNEPIRKAYEILGFLSVTRRLFNRERMTPLFHPSRFPEPIYSCPLCRQPVVLPPTKDEILVAIVAESALANNHRSSQPVMDTNPFQRFFPCIFTDKITRGELEDTWEMADWAVERKIAELYPDLIHIEPDSDESGSTSTYDISLFSIDAPFLIDGNVTVVRVQNRYWKESVFIFHDDFT